MTNDGWGDLPSGDLVADLDAAAAGWAMASAVGVPRSEAEVHLRAALDAAFDGFSLLRAVRERGEIVDFEITYTNEIGAALAGHELRDIIARRLSEITSSTAQVTSSSASSSAQSTAVDRGTGDASLVDRYRRVAETGESDLDQFGDPEVGSVWEIKATRIAPDTVALSYRDVTHRARQEGRITASETAARVAVGRILALQAATAALARAITVADVYEVMTGQVRPIAGWQSLVVMLREDQHLVVSHASGLSRSAVQNLRNPPLDDPYPMSSVVRNRTAVFYADESAYLADFPERSMQIRGAEQRAWAFIPLLSADRAIGAMAIGYRDPREFDASEREALTSLGALYAQAIERAMLFEAQRSIAADLQRALLPVTLPDIPGARHAVRYLPWTSGADVGGDWYDIIPLDGESIGVAIGDVAGHSMTAAATMGQLRNALRAYALEGHSPTSVMERVNRLLQHVEPDALATCCYLELHLAEGTATVVLAGHLPPILCHAGDASPLDLRLGVPLGVSPAAGYVDTTVLVPPGSTLVLFTDGLVEDRRVPIGQGMAELCAALASGPIGDPAALVERVLAAGIGPRPRRDDVALLAIGLDAQSRPVDEVSAGRRFQSDATSAASARRFAGDLLCAWGLGGLVDTTRLLLGEIITNAVQHTVGDVAVRLLLRESRLRVEVHDGSERRPDLREVEPDAESGRGLRIVASLADAWGHDARETGGKVVWFELVV